MSSSNLVTPPHHGKCPFFSNCGTNCDKCTINCAYEPDVEDYCKNYVILSDGFTK